MKTTLTLRNGDVLTLRPEPDAPNVEVPRACPGCKAEPYRVTGCGREIDPEHRHDTYRADAACTACGTRVGVLRVKVSTLFGLEEDERLARMGVRIY